MIDSALCETNSVRRSRTTHQLAVDFENSTDPDNGLIITFINSCHSAPEPNPEPETSFAQFIRECVIAKSFADFNREKELIKSFRDFLTPPAREPPFRPTPSFNASLELYTMDIKIRRFYKHKQKSMFSDDAREAHARNAKKQDELFGKPVSTIAKRKAITKLSESAQRREKWECRNLRNAKAFVTLTYPNNFPWDGRVVKKHLHVFEQWLLRRGCSGFWTMEYQQRGAPHFHLIIDTFIPYKELAQEWYQVVDSGDPKHLEAGTQIGKIRNVYATCVYAAKYFAKDYQKTVPAGFEHVGRFWGHFGINMRTEKVIVAQGTVKQMNNVIRFVKRLNVAERRKWTSLPPRPDNGLYSFTLYSLAKEILKQSKTSFFYDLCANIS